MLTPMDSTWYWIGTLPHQTVVAELLTRPERTLKLLPSEVSHLKECLACAVNHEEQLSVAWNASEDLSEIIVLEQRVESLRQLRGEIMSILSPIRQLPTELLSMIFYHLKDGYYLRVPTSRPPFWDIMTVCRQWYNVCDTSCPSLWASIMIHFDHPRSPMLSRLLATTLSRSGRHPLSISVCDYDPRKSGRLVDEVYRLLVQHSDRWQSFDAQTCSARECKCLDGVRGKLGRLRTLSLGCLDAFDDIDPSYAFRDAPNLQYVDLANFPIHTALLDDISRLTSFRWSSVHEEQVPDFPTRMLYLEGLERSDTLVCFEYMAFPAPYTPRTDPPEPILKPLMTELRVSDPAFLTSLQLPSLTVLVFGDYDDDDNMPMESYPPETVPMIYAMLERSQCRLVTLVLKNVDLDPVLLSILHGSVAGSLQELTIRLTEWTSELDELFKAFVDLLGEENNGAFTFLPSLQALELKLKDRNENEVWAEYAFIDEVFAEVVLSRLECSAVRTVLLAVYSFGGHWPIHWSTVQVLQQTPGVLLTLWDLDESMIAIDLDLLP